MDGTLVNIDHRLHHIQNKPKNWKKFYENLELDEPIPEMVWLARTISTAENYEDDYRNPIFLVCTGRKEKYRRETQLKLQEAFIYCNEVFMRPLNDFRPDYVVKAELADQIIEKYGKIDLWVDDKPEVCEAIRAKGIQVLQVLKKV